MPKNIPIIKKGVKKAAPRLFVPELRAETARRFASVKNQMIAEFLSHPVTIELQGGVTSPNISGTLQGKGNLFSFIGFNSGDKPIEPILDALQSTNIVFTKMIATGIESEIRMPSADEIFAMTPMPWAEGRSWSHGIESGISGLGWYLNIGGLGRSEGGIQSSQQVFRNVKFRNTKYISNLLNKYANLFKSL